MKLFRRAEYVLFNIISNVIDFDILVFVINIISVEIEGQNDKPPTYTEAVQVQDESDTMLPKYKDIQKDDE